jgi:hypothetical protein
VVRVHREYNSPDDNGHAAGDDDLAGILGVHIEILSLLGDKWVGHAPRSGAQRP